MTTTRGTVLLVEDDRRTAETLRLYLVRAGFACVHVSSGAEVLAACAREQPVLVLLDVMLPERDGFSLCRELRARGPLPILLLTARSTEEDVLKGLGLGADDYVTKPFSPRQVLARIEAILRRAMPSSRVRLGTLALDAQRHEASLEGETLALTPVEFALLCALGARPRRVLTRAELLVRAGDRAAGPRVVDVHVAHLRRKLLASPRAPQIESVYGVGYRLREPGG